jgi:tetratricopeptide (TPR) repeat protein
MNAHAGARVFAARPWLIVAGIALCLLSSSLLGQQAPAASPCDSASALQHADQLLKQKHYEEAQSGLAVLYSCPNLSPLETFNIGWFYGRAHNFEKAIAIFQSVSPDIPDLPTHQYAIGLSQFELGDYKSAASTLKELQAKGSLTADAVNLLGVSYSKLGQYQAAYAVFAEELRRDPSDLDASFNLITLFADAGHFADAVGIASQAIAAFPGNADLLAARGAASMLLGKIGEAHDDFAAAVRLSPGKGSLQFLLALSDYKRGDYEASAASLRTAIQSGVADSDLYYLLAECLLKLSPTKPQDAIAELDRAIALNSESVSARSLRGKLYLEENRPQDAVIDLQLAHRIDPASRSAIYNLARAYTATGKPDEAKQLYLQLNKESVDSVSELSDRKLKEALSTGTGK